jgi:hypothetical protein
MVRSHQKDKGLPIRVIEVLWKTKQDMVDKEISRMIDEESRTETRFELRTTASKNILQKMTEIEMEELKKAGEEMAKNGYPEDVKRR